MDADLSNISSGAAQDPRQQERIARLNRRLTEAPGSAGPLGPSGSMLALPTGDTAAAPPDDGGRRPGMTAAAAGLLTREALEPSFDAVTAREVSPAGSPRRAAGAQVPPPRYRDDDTKSSLHFQEEIPTSPGAPAGRRRQQQEVAQRPNRQQQEGGVSGRGGQPAASQQGGAETLEQRKGVSPLSLNGVAKRKSEAVEEPASALRRKAPARDTAHLQAATPASNAVAPASTAQNLGKGQTSLELLWNRGPGNVDAAPSTQPENTTVGAPLSRAPLSTGEVKPKPAEVKSRAAELEQELERLRRSLEEKDRDLAQKADRLKLTEVELQRMLDTQRQHEDWSRSAQDMVARLARRAATAERARVAQDIALRKGTLGSFGVQRFGNRIFESWEDGLAFQLKRQRKQEIESEVSDLEQQRKELRKQPPGSMGITDEVVKGKIDSLKKEEKRIDEELRELESVKKHFVREMKRFNDEGESQFLNSQPLNRRYALQNLLGRGGFSEVYKAVDVLEMREIAIKIHKVEASWSDQRKIQYIRHTVREFEIHKALRHRRIAQLLDTFEIDTNTFATVMELCDGGDLDQHLRTYGHLPEKEAKQIMGQVLEGLDYLNAAGVDKPRVIHYDLKPANILFTSMFEVKISDFGLSKSYVDGQTLAGIELTSPGAGTYWYLPPECFAQHAQARVSSKVDVWSAGVIFFQMLYGKRPFGDENSQLEIMQSNLIALLAQRGVDFPASPKVSQDAKDFIKRCLTVDQNNRPDVTQAKNDTYFSPKR